MKTSLVLTTASLTALILAFARADEPAKKPAEPPAESPVLSPKLRAFLKPIAPAADDKELTKKLKERHNSAVALLDERLKEYGKGIRDISSVYESARLALDARLDLTADAAARTEVLEQALDVAKLFEAHLQQQLAKGFGAKSDFERARYARLSLEVELLRAKDKNAPKPN